MRTTLRLLAAFALALTAVVLTAAPAPAAVRPAGAVGTAAIDPAFPASWPRWRPRVQNPATRLRLAMDAQYSGGDGSPVWLWGNNDGDAQLWVGENASEGGMYLHPSYNRWLCMGVNTTGWGSPVYVQNCNGSANQRWWVDWARDEIRNVPENLCIDVPGSNFAAGQTLQLWGCNHTAAQRWVRAAPSRGNNASRPIYFVPGYTGSEGHDCNEVWGDAINAMRSWGWTGTVRKTGHYQWDVNCDAQLIRGTVETPIEEIGKRLAWDIYNTYSHNGISVDIIAHSMGGLIARSAIDGVRNKPESNGWPPYIYVEDVVTLSTPHTGINSVAINLFCRGLRQCDEMKEGSTFLSSLLPSPQSNMAGTDWTLIGAGDDDTVEAGSAEGMATQHKVTFRCCHYGLEHNQLPHAVTPPSEGYTVDYWNFSDGVWRTQTNAASPIRTSWTALYYWNDW